MIFAIAAHTFREATRKKILHVLIGLGVAIMAVSPFIPTTDEPDARVKMVLVVFFQAVLLVCTLGIIFLSATALPREIEDKTIYGIVSKPVSRLKIIAGKVMGYALILLFVMTVLGLLNFIAVRRAASKLPEEYTGIIKARNEVTPARFSIQGKLHHAREGLAWIAGGRAGVASWSFHGLHDKAKRRIPLEIEFTSRVESDRGFADAIPLAVVVENTALTRIKTEIVSARPDEPITLKLGSGIVRSTGDVHINVFPILGTDYIGVTQNSLRVLALQGGFAPNYGKAVGIAFLKSLLIVIVAVMASAYLSAPVSILATLTVFLCGHILDFIRDFSLLMHGHHAHTHEGILSAPLKEPNVFLVYLDYLIRKPLEWLSVILPDFKRFDGLPFLLKGMNIPWETVGILTGYTAVYAGICFFLSFLILRKREFL